MASGERSIMFVTGNEGKAREVALYTTVPVNHGKWDVPELQSPFLEDVVVHKAKGAFQLVKGETGRAQPVLVEDTALTFHAWKNLPGTFAKWFMESVGNQGLVKMLGAETDRSATAETAFALCTDGTEVVIFKGATKGNIAYEPRGEQGFAWDKIFIPASGDGRTWAEMNPEEKQADSMRAKALTAFANYYKS